MTAPSKSRRLPLMHAGSDAPLPAGDRRLRIALVLPYGELHDGFFPDTVVEVACTALRDVGHDARIVRVWYDGHDGVADARIAARLGEWLDERRPELVVIERLFDPAPLLTYAARTGARLALVTWGDGDGTGDVHYVVGRTGGRTRGGTSRRSPSAGELVQGILSLAAYIAADDESPLPPGVAAVRDGELVDGPATDARPLPSPFRPTLAHDVIAGGVVPTTRRKYLFGNAGCPYASDPAELGFYAGVALDGPRLARLGCTFCHAGGDYQKRPDDEVVASLVEQALVYARALPDIDELVIVDQHAHRLLEATITRAAAAGIRPLTWLFSTRADAFIRERARVAAAIEAAARAGARVEVFLSGFESFSDRELARYNKGVTAAELLAAVATMRELGRAYPDVFEHARARGHSLVLWSPWTTPQDLHETVDHFRSAQLATLFDEPARNRLRLYPDLPITLAAERDGATLETWEEGDTGAGRAKGYGVERPWRFLDARTRLAHDLARALGDRLGRSTEIAQLAAAASFAQEARDTSASVVARVVDELDALDTLLCDLSRGRAGHPRIARRDATLVRLGGACNNACGGCQNGERVAPHEVDRVRAAIAAARTTSSAGVLVAGREPTLHDGLPGYLTAARGEDARPVGIVTNGRRFAVPRYAAALARSGLQSARVKVFGASDSVADCYTRAPGGHAQTLVGLRAARGAGITTEALIVLHAGLVAELRAVPEALVHRVSQVRFAVALDALGLGALGAAQASLESAIARADAIGLAVDGAPLGGGVDGPTVLVLDRPTAARSDSSARASRGAS